LRPLGSINARSSRRDVFVEKAGSTFIYRPRTAGCEDLPVLLYRDRTGVIGGAGAHIGQDHSAGAEARVQHSAEAGDPSTELSFEEYKDLAQELLRLPSVRTR
jgi:hypothetical protein